MKKVLKILLIIILIPYVASVIFLTICLLNTNNYGLTQLGDQVFIVIDDIKTDDYKNGDLVIVKKEQSSQINENDYTFYYSEDEEIITVKYGQVNGKEIVNEDETTFLIDETRLSSEYIIGTNKNIKLYSSAGVIFNTLTSRYGYLFYVILPVLVIFIYEAYILINHIKNKKRNTNEK